MRARRRIGFTTLLVAGVVLVSACSNSTSSGKSQSTIPVNGGSSTPTTAADLTKHLPNSSPGVTDTEIKVDAVVTQTGSPTGNFATFADGLRAYFRMINDQGGIYGRKLTLRSVRDDQLGSNDQQVRAALATHPFAMFGASVLFTGAPVLARANIPTFIWNINPEFTGNNNMFADKGALCFKCAGHTLPFVAKQLGATRIGIIGYGVSAESKDCATGIENSFKAHGAGAKVVYEDKSLSFAAPLAAQVTAMKNAGVQFVGTCIDINESFTLGKEMNRQGLKAVQELPNGYDPSFVSKNADVLEGDIVSPQFVAFEHTPQIPEIKRMMDAFRTINATPSEVGTGGWVVADEFYTGLKMAGPSFTQQKVIDALNTLTAYDDNGMIAPIDWTKQHIDPLTHPEARGRECYNFVKVVNGKFEAVFDQPGKQFVCFKDSDPGIDTPTYETFAG